MDAKMQVQEERIKVLDLSDNGKLPVSQCVTGFVQSRRKPVSSDV